MDEDSLKKIFKVANDKKDKLLNIFKNYSLDAYKKASLHSDRVEVDVTELESLLFPDDFEFEQSNIPVIGIQK